ncbi:hypothetical protein D9M72_609510 [compost metagenome]
MKFPVLSSNQKAPFGVCPAGRIEARSFKETPTTFPWKLVASLNSSVTVVDQRFFGEWLPIFVLVVPTG